MKKASNNNHDFVAGETVWMNVSRHGFCGPRVVERVTPTQVILKPIDKDVEPFERFMCRGGRGRLVGSRDKWHYVTIYKLTPEHEAFMRTRELRKRLDVIAGELSGVAERVADSPGISEDVMSECLAAIDGWDDTVERIRTLITDDTGDET